MLYNCNDMHTDIRRLYWYATNLQFRRLTSLSLSVFILGVVFNFYSGVYATEVQSNPVTDIVLSNTPALDLAGIFVWGGIALIAFVCLLLLYHPQTLPFTLASLGIFYLVRAIFVSLTHIGPFPNQDTADVGIIITKFFFGGDLFFSGHTGAPFLLALIFWHHRPLRYIFLASSFILGGAALLAHVHYSIDILAAFFITYTIFHICEWLFPLQRRVFHEGLTAEPAKN